jgi:hypothetical protein
MSLEPGLPHSSLLTSGEDAMGRYLESVSNAVLDRTPQEWIVGLVVALFLALALAGVLLALRRWVKIQDETAPLVGTALVAIFAGMVIAGIYVQLDRRASAGQAAARGPGGPGGMPGGGPGGRGGGGGGAGGGRFATTLAGLIFDNADADHDGVITTEEAASAAAKFVHESGSDGKDKLDRDTLANILRERMRPGGGGGGANAAPQPGGASGGRAAPTPSPAPEPTKGAPAPPSS